MNSTDLRGLLAAPTVSRASFFTDFLSESGKAGQPPVFASFGDGYVEAGEEASDPAPTPRAEWPDEFTA